MGGMFNICDDTPAAPASVKANTNRNTSDSDWTDEQDKRLMELKSEDKPWKDLAVEVGKSMSSCKERFKQIKPKDWRPNSAAQKNNNGNSKQKGQNNRSNQNGGGNKQNEQQVTPGAWPDPVDSAPCQNTNNEGFDPNQDDPWGSGGGAGDNGGFDASKDDPWSSGGGAGASDPSGENADNGGFDASKDDPWSSGGGAGGNDPLGENKGDGADGGFKDDGNTWGAGQGSSGNDNGADAWANNVDDGWGAINNTGGGTDTKWDTTPLPGNNASNDKTSRNTSSRRDSAHRSSHKSSNKPPSKPASKQHSVRGSDKPPQAAPSEYELKPDSTFSADDLRLIAKILQQDCQLVWNRVSWRFKDKTGRNLHPDVFEEKITGTVERGTERGRKAQLGTDLSNNQRKYKSNNPISRGKDSDTPLICLSEAPANRYFDVPLGFSPGPPDMLHGSTEKAPM
ncbi:hypothetical protein OPT61_g451 [Boeremia exigua]|uniref:Uncharacterized protein n=1 Tax=Boeremia exigua TaxID=749465 RepID=A0ACC2ITP8_9PLEO|nr:hypothetical protein OPT61_g451 [Boeremia exigua]